ncbi:hypothetical protein OsI_22852 [Oryza sativa Indica Group]|uniref:Uncharacterized protein n=1 Tax=Oryza sativa subsp. indica TaxID=39946 RepID=B8B1R0_ORYSI|nr:hypothetical protein OsI_22852 [Oryza sativa Indica Group]
MGPLDQAYSVTTVRRKLVAPRRGNGGGFRLDRLVSGHETHDLQIVDVLLMLDIMALKEALGHCEPGEFGFNKTQGSSTVPTAQYRKSLTPSSPYAKPMRELII